MPLIGSGRKYVRYCPGTCLSSIYKDFTRFCVRTTGHFGA